MVTFVDKNTSQRGNILKIEMMTQIIKTPLDRLEFIAVCPN